MKHFPDLDLVILRLIEAHSDAGRFVDFSSVKGHSADQIGYQVGLLGQRGLVEVVDTGTLNEPNDWSAVGLTHIGHEHLKAIGASSSDGGADQRTLLQRWKYQLEQKPLIAVLMLLFGILVALSGGWRIVVGDHLWESISSYINVENVTLEECIIDANDTELEILKCKTKFGVPL